MLAVLKHGFAKGDSSSAVPLFPAIYKQYFDFVWSSTRRLGVHPDAMDDVVQEVFIVIHSRLDTLERPEALRSWIYSIVRRTVSNHRRSTRIREAAASGAITSPELESDAPTPFELTEKNAELSLLANLLAQIDEPKREVLMLVEFEEMSVPEVAEVLDIALNTAYSRLRAARQAFDAALARHEARVGRK